MSVPSVTDGLPGTWPARLTPAIFAKQRTITGPKVSPRGDQVAFAMEDDGRTDLYVLTPGGWPLQITADHALAGGSYDWSPDGRTIVFTAAGDGKLWLGSAVGSEPRRLTRLEGRHHTPRYSPDGRFISFLCDRGEEVDVVVIS